MPLAKNFKRGGVYLEGFTGIKFLVISPSDFNETFQMVLACPVMVKNPSEIRHGFEVDSGNGREFIICHCVKTIDIKDKNITNLGPMPKRIVDDVLARCRTVLT